MSSLVSAGLIRRPETEGEDVREEPLRGAWTLMGHTQRLLPIPPYRARQRERERERDTHTQRERERERGKEIGLI